nr:immunoglobulin light chain junction region [Macaca mulatta]MPN66054.1 immunoglobulin light chain junction region [Macaca mulatta]MPN66529.1 immunoglobulin light chain junction region [Macaca mulatta]MPN66859.1 immunoglobulin light chain junction region [Macaca mulatta]MPN67237.1 immunoglobulin light chain junction region [Macaca mulatta]
CDIRHDSINGDVF